MSYHKEKSMNIEHMPLFNSCYAYTYIHLQMGERI